MGIITLTTCNSSIEANLIKNQLENEGIKCFLTNENFSSLMPNYAGILGSGVQVMIDENDRSKAFKIIEEQDKAIELKCPNCNSEKIAFGLGLNRVKKLFIIVLSLFMSAPIKNITNTYYCKDCKTEFKN
jgi:hypothetical protein